MGYQTRKKIGGLEDRINRKYLNFERYRMQVKVLRRLVTRVYANSRELLG